MKKKLFSIVIICVLMVASLVTVSVCFGQSHSGIQGQSIKIIKGTVQDNLMGTIQITTKAGKHLSLEKKDYMISESLKRGEKVVVGYRGTLDYVQREHYKIQFIGRISDNNFNKSLLKMEGNVFDASMNNIIVKTAKGNKYRFSVKDSSKYLLEDGITLKDQVLVVYTKNNDIRNVVLIANYK